MTSLQPLSAARSRPRGPSQAEAAAELLRRRRARSSLLDFTTFTKPDYEVGWHHQLLAGYLDRFAAGQIKRLIVNMPPRHGKSELASRRLPALLLGQDPDAAILACSHTASLASDMNRDVQRIIDGPDYHALFPGTRLNSGNVRTVAGAPLRNSDEFQIVDNSGYYKCAGVGGAIVGRGFRWGLIDDPIKSREEADSPTIREKVWSWYTGDFYTRRSPDASILVMATRWHPDDLPGRLLTLAEEDPNADQWTVLSLPALREETGHADDRRRPGDALWPERYGLDELAKTRAANPYEWWSQYQQHPRAQGSTEWPDEHFGWPGFWFDDWPANLNLKVMSLDPSKGIGSKAGDYQALILWGRTPDGTEWIEADMGKRPMVAARSPDGIALTEGMVENAVERYQGFAPEGLAVETNTFQQLLVLPIRAEARRRNIEVRIYEVDNTVNKNVRIRRLGEPLSQRRMRFRRTPGTRILVEQLKQFPAADHDDGPDGLEMVRRTAVSLWNGRPRRTS